MIISFLTRTWTTIQRVAQYRSGVHQNNSQFATSSDYLDSMNVQTKTDGDGRSV
ncbi:uncharacterized protein LAESUDRAFT_728276, partial [Laetiporus sulphureus 93-53]